MSTRFVVVAIAGLALTGCASPTSIRVDVDGASSNAQSLMATVSVPGKAPASRSFSSPTLPGTMILVLPDSALDVTVTVVLTRTDGTTLTATGMRTSVPHSQVDLSLELCPVGAILCDDFETGDTSRWSTKDSSGGAVGTLTVDGVHVHGGQHALHVAATVASVYGGNALGERLVTPVTSGVVAIRAFVYADGDGGKYEYLFGALNASGDGPRAGIANEMGQANTWQLGVPNGDVHFRAGLVLIPKTWTCVEFRVDAQSSTGMDSLHLLVDGNEVASASEPSSAPYSLVDVGLSQSSGDQQQDFFIDDVVVSSQPIGCN